MTRLNCRHHIVRGLALVLLVLITASDSFALTVSPLVPQRWLALQPLRLVSCDPDRNPHDGSLSRLDPRALFFNASDHLVNTLRQEVDQRILNGYEYLQISTVLLRANSNGYCVFHLAKAGDTNFDGVVNDADVNAVVNGIFLTIAALLGGERPVGLRWEDGDFNLDGLVDDKDVFTLCSATPAPGSELFAAMCSPGDGGGFDLLFGESLQ